jgi:NAD(P)-dependent dehydrogenase (short-subunit alcohol dehydrogenase family)
MNVLVTGTSSGLGFATAAALARRGHHVFAGMRAPETRDDGAPQRLREAGGPGLEVLPLDVVNDTSVAAAVARITDAVGPLDVVVNNAGIAAAGVTESFTAADAQRIFDINVLGPLRVTRAALPGMRSRGRGLFVNVTSTLGREVLPFLALYEGTKFALEGLWEAWRYELTSVGVDVVLVQPGTFPTTRIVANMLPPSEPERAASYAALQPRMGRFFDDLAAYARDERAPQPALVAEAIANVIGLPPGQRPTRVVVDPNGPGAAARINALADQEQASILAHLGLSDLASLDEAPR